MLFVSLIIIKIKKSGLAVNLQYLVFKVTWSRNNKQSKWENEEEKKKKKSERGREKD